MTRDTQIRFEGFLSPNTTPIPDQLFDELLPVLSGAELKVLLYICRRTFGFKKDSDNISLNQMLRGIARKDGRPLDGGVGLSKPTLLRALKSLVAKQVVLAERRESARKGNEPTNYRLNVLPSPLGKKMNLGLAQNFTEPLVKKSYPQETGNKKQLDNTVDGNLTKRTTSQRQVHPAARLDRLNHPPEHTELLAHDIADELGDRASLPFYFLIADRVPEAIIRRHVAEIKANGAKNPPSLFNHRMRRYAESQLLSAQNANISASKKDLFNARRRADP